MARRLVIVLVLAVALAIPTFAARGGSPAFVALADPSGVSYHGPIHLNQYLLDGARPIADVKISNGAEPMILASKLHPGRLWIGDTSGGYRSTNNGASWQAMPDPFIPSVVTDGRALAEDANGDLYIGTTIGPAAGVGVSHDGGQTFPLTQAMQAAALDTIADRPWLDARGNGDVILVVNGDRGEECYHTTDGGLVWTPSVNGGAANPGNLIRDTAGRMWYDDGVALERSTGPCTSMIQIPHAAGEGKAIFTQVDQDESGHIYYAGPSGDNGQMVLWAYTPGSGFRSLVVSDPALKSNTFPTLSVRSSGEIAVGWYGSETPGDPSVATYGGSWNVFVAQVKGFWTATPSVTTTRVSTQPNHVGDFCMGGIGCTTGAGDRDLADYFMIDYASDGALHIAYGHDGATSNAEVRYAQLAPLA